MKRPFLIFMSIVATGGFGYWLVVTPHTQREILLACGGWVLGFWVAAAIQSRRTARAERRTHEQDDEDWEEDSEQDEADFADGSDEADWDDDGEDWEEGGQRD